MCKTVKMNGNVEASTCARRGRQSRSTWRWSTAFLAVALGLATLGASAQTDEPREWKGRFGATVATGTLDLERTDAEFVAANAADAAVTKPKTVYFRDESGKLVKYNYAWLSSADRAEVDFALGLGAATIEDADDEIEFEEAAEPTPQRTKRNVGAASQPSSEDAGLKAGTRKVLTINGVEYAFRYCPAGTFTMGSPESERVIYGKLVGGNETQHRVTLTNGFWMLETEVTQEMWKSVMGNNPSVWDSDIRNPVENVNWADTQDFIAKLNDGGFAPAGFEFRLPTEAEWEYACRAGTSTAYSWGATLNGDKANCRGDMPYGTSTKGAYLERMCAVGRYDANAWGLYDMHGNVEEWCGDWYGNYASGSQTDPTGPTSGWGRVLRGGSCHSWAMGCRSASRSLNDPAYRSGGFGFRLVLGREL